MNEVFEKQFGFILEKAMSLKNPIRVAVAGADVENILQGTFEAAKKGFVFPVLVGNEEKIKAMIEQFHYTDCDYQLCPVSEDENVVQYAIDIVQSFLSFCNNISFFHLFCLIRRIIYST